MSLVALETGDGSELPGRHWGQVAAIVVVTEFLLTDCQCVRHIRLLINDERGVDTLTCH